MSEEAQRMAPLSVTTKDTFTALDFAWSDELAQSTAGINGPDVWRHLSRFFTGSMARHLWINWNPQESRRIEDKHFLRHFKTFLGHALELGYRLGRFRDVS